MFSVILYHTKTYYPVIELTGTSPEALISQANGYKNHYAFSPRKVGMQIAVDRNSDK